MSTETPIAIKSFEDIVAWQKAKWLTIEIYKNFRFCKEHAFKDQIQRAALSVMNNITEGYERNGNKEFRNFLFIAKGSSAEVRSMLDLAVEFDYITEVRKRELSNIALEIAKMLSGFIKKL